MNLDVLIGGAIRKYGHGTAVFDERRKVGFDKLGTRTNRLGSALAALGLVRGDRIALLQRNSIETIETDLTAARFGYVRTLLNARAPPTNSNRHTLRSLSNAYDRRPHGAHPPP